LDTYRTRLVSDVLAPSGPTAGRLLFPDATGFY
jgi:hypothetical protein